MRPLLWAYGVTKIKYSKLRINDLIASYKPTRDVSGTAPLVVCNHSSWLDMFFFLMFNVSFLSKSAVAKLPIVGMFATARQCLFLNRESETDRNQVMEMISTRTKRVVSHNDISPLLIFPEGTTTNGRALMSFKKGAFANCDPIKIYVLKYNTEPLSFVWSISNMNSLHVMLLSLSQLWNTIELLEYEDNFDPYWIYQTKNLDRTDPEAWRSVASAVKSLMAFAGNFHEDDTTLRSLQELVKESQVYNESLMTDKLSAKY